MQHFFQRVQRRILAGLVLIVPIAVTIAVAAFIYASIERVVGPLVDQFTRIPHLSNVIKDEQGHIRAEFNVPLTLILTFLLLYVAGFVSTTFVIRKLYGAGEQLLLRIPFLKSIYGLTKQILDLVMSRDKGAFKQIVLVEYPKVDSWAIGFVTGCTRFKDDPRPYVNLFVPTTPNPTSGFLLLVPREKVRAVRLSVEEGIKLIMSGGVISPDLIDHHPCVVEPAAVAPPRRGCAHLLFFAIIGSIHSCGVRGER